EAPRRTDIRLGKGDDVSDIEHLLDEKRTSKRQKQEQGVVKRLFSKSPTQENKFPSQNADGPSSPEHYEPSRTFRSTPAVLDISALIQSQRRPGDLLQRASISVCAEATSVVDTRVAPNSQGALGLLAVPIRVLREEEPERIQI
ncbi:unnamed protein product, partial [Pleuronectes platessa]